MSFANLEDLAYFAAVVAHGGFAPAERATGVPKSKLSRRVALLEQRLGLRLLQRTTRRFAVTPLGQEMARHARAMLAEAEAAESLAAEQSGSPRGLLRLSCPPALLQAGVQAMLCDFLRAWPLVRLEVQASNRNVDLWNESVDLALRVRMLPLRDDAEAVVKTLAPSPHVLVATPALCAELGQPQTPEELSRWPTLGLGNMPGEGLWALQGPEGEVATLRLAHRLVIDDMGALCEAALAGLGCAPLPVMMVGRALAEGRLVALLPGWSPPEGVVQAAFASRRGLRPAVRQLLDALGEGFAQRAAQGWGTMDLVAAGAGA